MFAQSRSSSQKLYVRADHFRDFQSKFVARRTALLQQNEPSDRGSSAPSPRGVSSELCIESYGTTYSDFAQVVDKLGASIEEQASQNPVAEGASSDVIPRVRVGLFTTDINRTFDVFGRCGVFSLPGVLECLAGAEDRSHFGSRRKPTPATFRLQAV